MQELDAVVIGAGVIGLSIARLLALRGREVVVLEKETQAAQHNSSRNSEVIHAGIYYPEGSLKSALCVRGKQLLVDYCLEKAVPHRVCGKLVVASDDEELQDLARIESLAKQAGVIDLQRWSAQRLQQHYPHLKAEHALFSPTTGIIDSHAYIQALLFDLELHGGLIACGNEAHSFESDGKSIYFSVGDEQGQFKTDCCINAAGCWAVDLFNQFDRKLGQKQITAYFAKGRYMSYASDVPFDRLIYPVPSPAGLGVHLTLDMAGRARFGPDVTWVDRADDYKVADADRATFAAAISAYWPEVDVDKLTPDYAGVRPKLVGPGQASSDFVVAGPKHHGHPGLYHMLGIESPGLTASLAIAEHVCNMVALELTG